MDRVQQLIQEKLEKAQYGYRMIQEKINLNDEENTELNDQLAAAAIEIQEYTDFLNNYQS